jgi:hypothetical protein
MTDFIVFQSSQDGKPREDPFRLFNSLWTMVYFRITMDFGFEKVLKKIFKNLNGGFPFQEILH